MRRTVTILAALAALLASCGPPQPTNGAFQPVNPQTGTPQGGAQNTE
jgi:ABC-type uncharacterized transport system auxiliary subunit